MVDAAASAARSSFEQPYSADRLARAARLANPDTVAMRGDSFTVSPRMQDARDGAIIGAAAGAEFGAGLGAIFAGIGVVPGTAIGSGVGMIAGGLFAYYNHTD